MEDRRDIEAAHGMEDQIEEMSQEIAELSQRLADAENDPDFIKELQKLLAMEHRGSLDYDGLVIELKQLLEDYDG